MVSRSKDRFSFQKNRYMQRCKENGIDPNNDYLDYFDNMAENHDKKFNDEETKKLNLEYDLLTTDWILQKVRQSEVYAQNLYAALCNNDFTKRDVWPILIGQKYSCSWRYAGGIIADMREEGDYIDWYCSGIRDTVSKDEMIDWSDEEIERYHTVYENYVGEGIITDEIRNDLYILGWLVTTGSTE